MKCQRCAIAASAALACWLPLGESAGLVRAQVPALTIVVIEGEDAVNIIRQKSAVTPIVEVRDRNGLPVSGASVTFAIGSARNAAFASGTQTLTVTTNAAGRAAATGLNPLGSGAFQINVQAAFQGETATATIVQTNVMTASASAGASGGGVAGGGLSNGAIASIAGGAAAATIAAVKVANRNSAPTVSAVTASPVVGLAAATRVSFTSQAGDPDNDSITYSWDFGDGTTSAIADPSHVYSTVGAFTVRLTVSDSRASASGTATVTIKSLSGTWNSLGTILSTVGPTTWLLTLAQSGASVTGTVQLTPTGGVPFPVGTLNGSVQESAPRIRLLPSGGPGIGANTVLALDSGGDFNTMSGTWSGGSTGGITSAAFVRQ